MKTFHATLYTILTLSVLSCTTHVRVKNNELSETLSDKVVNAFNSGDVGKLMELYTDDAIVISCGWRMCGKDSIAGGMKYLLEHASSLSFIPGPGRETPETLFLSGLMTFSWKNESYHATAKGMMNIVWKKQVDNSWKITWFQEDHGDIPEK